MSGAKLLGPPRLGTTPIPRLLCPSSGVQLGEWEKERFSRFWKVSALQQRPSESLPLRAGGVGGFAAGEETGAPRQVTSGPQQLRGLNSTAVLWTWGLCLASTTPSLSASGTLFPSPGSRGGRPSPLTM